MYNLILNNVEDVVISGICIGCMACMGMCPDGSINIKDGEMGFPVPVKSENCTNCGSCLQDCPANADGDGEYENRINKIHGGI